MDKVKYGIVGIGSQGTKYATFLKNGCVEGASLVAVADINPSRLEWAKEALDGVSRYSSYEEMIDRSDIDVVVIDVPHYYHPIIAEYALSHGKNVLTDKPIGVYTKRIREMLEVRNKYKDLAFGIVFNQRTNPLYRKAKEIISDPKSGKLIRVNWIITDWYRTSAYYKNGAWRATYREEGGGVLLNQSPHQLDLLTWLIGNPKSVYAVSKTVGRNIKVENDVTALLEFDDGVTGVFVTSTHDAPGTNRLEVTLESGKIVIENDELTYYKTEMLEPDFDRQNTEMWGAPKVEVIKYNEKLPEVKGSNGLLGHIAIFQNFTDYLLKKCDKLIAPGEDGINSLSLSNAIYLSEYLHKKIEFPFDEDLFIKYLEEMKSKELK
ncbi:MAG: Gfo/Idh/MocA family oxidoreductase [Gammaproteobacteria bacterium]|nr:Gfo/Idh/MocA family oxidoreductase [Gammaproteobacteria bacterium]